jgi:alpha-ketoglutarate-dependent taurine dioxygenase
LLFTQRPPRCSPLYCLEVPHKDCKTVGDTCSASTAAAFDGLPGDMKQRLTGLKALNSFKIRL